MADLLYGCVGVDGYQLHSEDEVVTFRSEHDAFHCL